MFDLTVLFETLITLVFVVLARYLIPAVKARLDTQKQEAVGEWVHIAVYAAEKLFGSGTGKAKFEYAKGLLEEKGFTFDENTLIALINAEIKKMENEESVVVVGDVAVTG